MKRNRRTYWKRLSLEDKASLLFGLALMALALAGFALYILKGMSL